MNRLFEALTTTLNSKGITFTQLKVVETQMLNEKGELESSYAIYAYIFKEDVNMWIPTKSNEHKQKYDAYKDFIKEAERVIKMEVVIHTSHRPLSNPTKNSKNESTNTSNQ